MRWRTALAEGAARLAAAGVEAPAADARILAGHVLGTDRGGLLAAAGEEAGPAALAAFGRLVERRAAREPVSRILGVREFWSLPFRLNAATLDPRPDSEAVVATALTRLPDRAAPWRLLDLGTGTGCLLLALLSELPAAFGVGVDLAPAAVAAARENARALGLAGRAAFLCGSWGEALTGGFDLVVANPPYVAEGEAGALAPEVRLHDPALALYAGTAGLAAIAALAAGLGRLLGPGGRAVIEVGAGQAAAAEGLLRAGGLAPSGRGRDLAGIERCVAVEKMVGITAL
jgi:release factor glutamine methyltransferase